MTANNEKDGKCDYCDSVNGYWFFGANWRCNDCNKTTQYFKITEKGKEVLRLLLGEPKEVES